MRGRWRRSQRRCPGFLSPFGRRHSLLGHPSPAGELGLPHGRLTGHRHRRRTPTGLSRCTRMRCGRGGCPLYPEDCGAHTAGRVSPAAARRFSAASPCTPDPNHPINRGSRVTRHHRGFTTVHPSGLPLTCNPRMEHGSLGSPPSFTPRRYQQRMSEWGRAHGHWPELRHRHQAVLHHVATRCVHPRGAPPNQRCRRRRRARRAPR